MKKNIFYFILGALIFSGITVFAETLIQSNLIAYDNSQSNIPATNVKDAIDYLYELTEPAPEGEIDLTLFPTGNVVNGLAPAVYSSSDLVDTYNVARTTYNYSFDSTSDFEITTDIFFENGAANLMGGTGIDFYYENQLVGRFVIRDSHADNVECITIATLNSTTSGEIIDRTNSNCSGRYSLVRQNGTLNVYYNNNVVYTTTFSDEFKFDRIDVLFYKYSSYPTVKSSINKIYVGDIVNY